MQPHERIVLYTADAISATAVVGTLLGYLPSAAALAGLIWYAIQIWESKTVQRILQRWRNKEADPCPTSPPDN